jgi:hypothetical protein
MATDTSLEIDATPDPGATATIPLATGGAISSAINTELLNTSGLFDTNVTNQQSVSSDAKLPDSVPDTSTSGNVTLQTTKRTDDMILINCLNGYIDVIYNISLSLVSKKAADKIRSGAIDSGEGVESGDYITFASTADSTTDITQASDGDNLDYYNIQALTFTNFVAHLPPNPLVAVAVDGKMRIFEPFGFQLREDLDAMGLGFGYDSGMAPHEYVYRLEIWFSGYDPITGIWIPQISIPAPTPTNSASILKSIIYFLTITAVEGKVNPTGTMYDISFVTSTYYATRPENIIMHKDNVGKGGTKIDGSKGMSFGQFLEQLAQRLHDQVYNDTQTKLDITYKFTGLKALFDAKFISDVNMDFSSGVSFNASDGSHAVTSNAMDIYTLIHNVMINLDLVRQLMLREDDKDFIDPGTWWNIRTRITQQESPNTDINSYTKYTFEYIFEPVLSYRSRMSEISDYNRQVFPSSQQQRYERMLDYGMIVRWYDYYFTGDNSEIVDFQFSFKNFFYQQIPYPGAEVSLRGLADNTPDFDKRTGISGSLLQNNAVGSQQTRDVIAPNISFTPSSSNSGGQTNSLLNIQSSPISANVPGNTNYGNIHQHRHRGPVLFVGNDSSGDAYATKSLAARDQYLRFDMLRANMTIRFDPQWLLNPYMADGDSSPIVPTEVVHGDNVTVHANIDRAIYINAYAPNQKSFMNPDTSLFNIRETKIIGGLYQVLKVVNEFEGGKFTQKLDLIKYEHLNYFSATGNRVGIQQSPSTFTAGGGFSNTQQDPNAGQIIVER